MEPQPEVEFLDAGDGGSDPHPLTRVRRRPDRATVALVLALVGAALAVIAPFQAAYRLQLPVSNDFSDGSNRNAPSFGVDGWGRYSATNAADAPGHAARLGIGYCVAAGVVLLGAYLWFAARRADGPYRHAWRRTGNGLVLSAAAAVFALTVTVLLSGQAVSDSYQEVLFNRVDGGSTLGSALLRTPSPRIEYGPLLWIGIGAAVLLVAAVVGRSSHSVQSAEN